MQQKTARLLLSLILIGSFLFFSNFSEARVLISKIQIAGVSTTDEFVELYNFGSSSVSIANWNLKKQTAGGTQSYLVSSFPSSAILNPFSYFLVAHHDYSPIQNVEADLQYSNNSNSLAANNSLLLFDDSNNLIDEANWGSVSSTYPPALNPIAGNSLVRLPNDAGGNYLDTDDSHLDFIEISSLPFNSLSLAHPTEDAAYPTTTDIGSGGTIPDPSPSSWNSLKINEVMPNPSSGDEWIELFNAGSSSLDLAGGILCDSRTSTTCTIATLTGILPARSWLAIYLSGSHLNNDGDAILLKNSNDEIVDRTEYGDAYILPKKGQSLVRVSDGVDTDNDLDWSATETLTPNSANVIFLPAPALTVNYSGGSSAVINSAGSQSYKTTPTTKNTPANTSTKNFVSLIWNVKIFSPIIVGSSTVFDAHLTSDPRGGEIFSTWDFGDGEFSEGARVTHTFASSGIFTIKINATSTQGTLGMKKLFIKVESNAAPQTGVQIYGVSPRPETDEEEWIGVRSFATNTIDLSGWRLGTENDHWYALPAGTNLSPGNSLKFFRSASHLALNNDGNTIILQSPLFQTIDLVSYGKSLPGQTYARTVDGWEWQSNEAVSEINNTSSKKLNESTGAYHNVSAAEAHDLPVGSLVFLTGVVESLPGMPGANYFFIRDASGGVEIYSNKKLFPNLLLGDTVQILGETGSFKNNIRVKTKFKEAIKIIRSKGLVKPNIKSVSEIDESDYGTLIGLEGEVTKIKSTLLYLDDGTEAEIALPKNAGINKNSLHEGDKIRVFGIVDQTNPAIRIIPRQPSDLIILNNQTLSASSTTTSSTSKIVAGTGGGVFLLSLAWAARKWAIR